MIAQKGVTLLSSLCVLMGGHHQLLGHLQEQWWPNSDPVFIQDWLVFVGLMVVDVILMFGWIQWWFDMKLSCLLQVSPGSAQCHSVQVGINPCYGECRIHEYVFIPGYMKIYVHFFYILQHWEGRVTCTLPSWQSRTCLSYIVYTMVLVLALPGHQQPCYWHSSSGNILVSAPGPWFNIKMSFYQYRKSHCGYKTVLRSSYLHNGISCNGKTASLYWIRAQRTVKMVSHQYRNYHYKDKIILSL